MEHWIELLVLYSRLPLLILHIVVYILVVSSMATHSSILAWRILWTEEPDGLQSIRLQRVRLDWAANTHTHTQHLLVQLWPGPQTYSGTEHNTAQLTTGSQISRTHQLASPIQENECVQAKVWIGHHPKFSDPSPLATVGSQYKLWKIAQRDYEQS